MQLLLVRHGNTFATGQTPVMVGARTDLPLVAEGVAQAHALGLALQQAKMQPQQAFCGPLLRTRQHLQEVLHSAYCHTPITIDERLREIDYGAWEGLSNAEIEQRYGKAPLQNWQQQHEYPAGAGWQPRAEQIEENILNILAALSSPLTLLCSSNGILRFFALAVLNPPDDAKMGTGRVSLLQKTAQGWHCQGWNQPPEWLLTL